MYADDQEDKDEMEFEYKKVDKRAEAEATPPEQADGEAEAEEETAEAATDAQARAEPGEDSAAAEPQAQAEQAAAEAEAAEGLHLDIYQTLRLFVGMVSEQAWINLGLQLGPGEQETEVKLPEAKIAIDTLRFIRQQLDDDLEEAEKRELDNLVSTLQMNYIQRT